MGDQSGPDRTNPKEAEFPDLKNITDYAVNLDEYRPMGELGQSALAGSGKVRAS
jgi:hypothetical protein